MSILPRRGSVANIVSLAGKTLLLQAGYVEGGRVQGIEWREVDSNVSGVTGWRRCAMGIDVSFSHTWKE